MKYFFVDTLSYDDPKDYFVDGRPEALGLSSWRMARGAKVADRWPSKPAVIHPSDKTVAVKLPSIIPTTLSYLIVSSTVRKLIEVHCPEAEIEYLPLVLFSKKKREQSRDYCMVNPLGVVDCLDPTRSQIVYSQSTPGAVVGVDKFVLDPERLRTAPALFRIKEAPGEYVVNESLAEALRAPDLSNVHLSEIEKAPEKAS